MHFSPPILKFNFLVPCILVFIIFGKKGRMEWWMIELEGGRRWHLEGKGREGWIQQVWRCMNGWSTSEGLVFLLDFCCPLCDSRNLSKFVLGLFEKKLWYNENLRILILNLSNIVFIYEDDDMMKNNNEDDKHNVLFRLITCSLFVKLFF